MKNILTMKTIKHAKDKHDHLKLSYSLRPWLTTSPVIPKQNTFKRHSWTAVFCTALAIPVTVFYTDEGPHHLTCAGYAPTAVSSEAPRTLTTKPIFMTISYTCWGTNPVSAGLMNVFGKSSQCSISVNGKPAIQAAWEERIIRATNRETTEFDSNTGIMTATLPRLQQVMGAERALVATCKRQWF